MVNTDPYPDAPGQSGNISNIKSLLGVGAYTIDDSTEGSGLSFGQDVTGEDFVKSFVYSMAMNMGPGDGSIASAVTNLGTFLNTMSLDALKLLQPFIPGSTDADFSDVSTAAAAIINQFNVAAMMSIEDFNNWVDSILAPLGTAWNDAKAWWDTVFAQLSTYPPVGSSAATVATWWSTLLVDLGLSPTDAASIANFISGNYDAAKQAKQAWDDFWASLGVTTGTGAAGVVTTNTTMINQISDIFNGLVVTPINTAVQQFKDWWNNLWQPQTATVASTVVNVKNAQSFQISAITTGYRNPSWVCRYPMGDVTYPESQNSGLTVYDSAGATAPPTGANIPYRALPAAWVVAQNNGRGGYITISNTMIMDTVGMVVSWNGVALTANSVFMEVFRENSDLSLTRIYSFDITANLTTSLQYVEKTLSPGLICNAGERYLVRFRSISSTGVVGVQGLDMNPTSVRAAHATTGTGQTNVSSYNATDAQTYNTIGGVYPWALLASKAGTATDQLYSDDFNRSQMGSLWFLQSTWATQLGVTGNVAAYQGSTNGDQAALYVRPTASDRMRVEGQFYNTAIAITGAREGLILNANRDLTQRVYLSIGIADAKIMSYSAGTPTQRASITSLLNDVPWQFYYDPATNTYTALKNGASVGLSWVDTGNLMSHGANARYGGLQISRVSSGNAGNIDSWLLEDWS